MIDPTFTKVNRFIVLSLENENDKTSFLKYYIPNVQIKAFNVLIDGKGFFEMPMKNGEETYEKIIEMRRNNDYTIGNLFYYEYFSKHYNLITVDLSKKNWLQNPDLKQQINFIGRLTKNEGASIFLIIEKSDETASEFSQNAVTAVWFWLIIKMETQKFANFLGDVDNKSRK